MAERDFFTGDPLKGLSNLEQDASGTFASEMQSLGLESLASVVSRLPSLDDTKKSEQFGSTARRDLYYLAEVQFQKQPEEFDRFQRRYVVDPDETLGDFVSRVQSVFAWDVLIQQGFITQSLHGRKIPYFDRLEWRQRMVDEHMPNIVGADWQNYQNLLARRR